MMTFLNWFDTAEVRQFANELATEFSRRFPATHDETEKKQMESRLRGAKDLMMSRTQVFAERHKLNLYKRAKLANILRWRLQELGYDRDLTQSVVYEVVRIVTLIRSSRADTRLF